MEVAVADVSAWGLAAAGGVPAAAVGDPGQLLDIDMDQLAGPVPLVAAYRLGGRGAVATIQATQTGRIQDPLHRR